MSMLDLELPDYVGKRPAATTANLEALLKHYGVTLSYDVIGKKVVTEGLINCGDLSEEADYQEIMSLAAKHGLPESIGNRAAIIAGNNAFNPVLDYIKSKAWDGVSRLDTLYKTVTVEADEEAYKQAVMRMWFIQCVAAADGAENTPNKDAKCKFESVLTFQGGQGYGKTRWFRSLVDNVLEDYLQDGAALDTNNKDVVATLTSHWLVELGELDATTKKSDVSEFKSFMSRMFDIFRRPYARKDCKYRRRTSFFATVNPSSFLVDATGSRRIIPVRTVNIEPLPRDYPRQQLWAELYHLYMTGEQWWPTQAQALAIVAYSACHQQVSPIEEAIDDMYDLSNNRYGADVPILSCTAILKTIGRDRPSRAERNEVAEIMRKYHVQYVDSNNKGFRLALLTDNHPKLETYSEDRAYKEAIH